MVDKKTGLKPKASAKSSAKTSKTIVEVKKAKPEPQLEKTKKPAKQEVGAAVDKIEESTVVESEESEKDLAKAGKHSAKAIREAEELAAKEARKAEAKTSEEKLKVLQKPPRTKLERAGKKYREVAKLIDKDKTYSLAEAIELATKTNPSKFDATVEMHFNLGVDPKQADHNIRGTVDLPSGTGKNIRVAVFAEPEEAAKAKAAGADLAASDELLAALDKEQTDFDILITTPTLMPKLGKYARFLGPKGLMPNPKSGSITTDLAKAVKEAKAGRVEYRVDPAGIIHLPIGKVSFGPDKLNQNAEAVANSIKAAKPASLKAIYIKSAYITTTMGPGIVFNP